MKVIFLYFTCGTDAELVAYAYRLYYYRDGDTFSNKEVL